jgi:Tfp pilus assembly protein FimT
MFAALTARTSLFSRVIVPMRCGSIKIEHRLAVTLIEVIMVIALLAAAAVASSVMFDGDFLSRRRVKGATHDLAESLIIARNTAILNQAGVLVQRSRNQGVETLQIREDAGPFRAGKTWVFELGSDVRLAGKPAQIQFTPMGTADRSLNWTVSESGIKGEVSVEPASGQIKRQLP